MSKPFNTLRKKMSAAAQKVAAEKTQQMLKEMRLNELQERLAELLSTKSSSSS